MTTFGLCRNGTTNPFIPTVVHISRSLPAAAISSPQRRINNCRSDIKFLELGLLRVPAVFSKLEPYRDSVRHGTSELLLANRASDWLDALELLVMDETLREPIAENAHAAVTAHHLLEEHSHWWLDTYSRIR